MVRSSIDSDEDTLEIEEDSDEETLDVEEVGDEEMVEVMIDENARGAIHLEQPAPSDIGGWQTVLNTAYELKDTLHGMLCALLADHSVPQTQKDLLNVGLVNELVDCERNLARVHMNLYNAHRLCDGIDYDLD